MEKTGFVTTGYIDKKGEPNGANAKFNQMPPGQDIENQKNSDIRSLPMKEVTSRSYPGDGGFPNS